MIFPSSLVFLAFAASAQVAVPPLKARVADLTGTLSQQQRSALEQTLAEFESRKGAQIAVLLVPSTQPESIEQYAVRVEAAWKLGRKGVDDSALLLVAKNDRRLRIEVGYGLEGALPDAVAKRIIEEDITPRFKQGDFYGGIRAGTDRMMRIVEGEKLPVVGDDDWFWRKWDTTLWIAAVLGVVLFAWVCARLVPNWRQAATPAAVGIVAGSAIAIAKDPFLGIFAGSLIFGFALYIATLLRATLGVAWQSHGDHWSENGTWTSSGSDPGWSSGSSSGAWSGGDSGGSFSGGGGSSGGGGASGSW